MAWSAQPNNFQRLGIVGMVRFCLLRPASLARKFYQTAVSYFRPSTRSDSSLFTSVRTHVRSAVVFGMQFSVVAMVSGVAICAPSLSYGPLWLSEAF